MMAIISFLVAGLFSVTHAVVDADKFDQLPGFNGTLPSDSYSGYLTVSNTKALHYVFLSS
jgi:carboxypeptidase C (cathepsin A)